MTDYTTMNGAEFSASVGADPDKWAEAFCQRQAVHGVRGLTLDNVRHWFRNAMDAAVREIKQPVNPPV